MSSEAPFPLGGSSEQATIDAAALPIHERHRDATLAVIPRWYNPAVHLAIPTLIGVTVLVSALSRIRSLRAIELLAIPATLLLAFAFEWRAHKDVLHRRLPLLGTIYDRHELQHHVIYTYDDMALRSYREFQLILMPAYAIVLVALLNAPLTYVAMKLFAPNVGLLFLATSMVFFLTYEWLHLSYHLPPTHPIGRLHVIGRLRELHRRHHDPRLMKKWNFNVTVPVFDWVHGTMWSPEREARRAAKRARPANGSPVPPSPSPS